VKAYHKRLLSVLITIVLLLCVSSVFISSVFTVDASQLHIDPQGSASSAQGLNRSDGQLPGKAELDADGYDTVLANGFEQVLTDGKSTLYFRDDTAEIALQDLATGHIWYSNPQDRDQETMVEGTTRLRIGAQLTVAYYDSQGTYGQMDSYNDAIAYDGVKWEQTDNELIVHYRLGKTVVTLADVPQQISKSRLDGFLSVLSEKDQKDFLKNYKLASVTGRDQSYVDKMVEKYPNVINEDTYYLTKDSTRILTKIRTWLDECGYTDEDLDYDNKVNQIEVEASSRAFFAMTMTYRLDEGALVVTLKGDSLEYDETIPPNEINILEYFGAGGKTEKGYMLMPDGSGTLIYYNNGRTTETPFAMRIYGNDTVSETESAYVADKKVSLPVFGVKNGKAAMLAVVEEGAATVSLNARVNGMFNSYNTVYPSMLATAVDRMNISDSQQVYFEAEPYRGDVVIRYQPLKEEDNDYMGMARAYRQMLLEAGTLKAQAESVYPLALDVIGAAPTTELVAGMPVEVMEPMTTFAQMAEIANALPAKGNAVWLRMEGWMKDGLQQKAVTGISVESKLGGEEGLKQLLADAQEQGWQVLPEVWLATAFDKGGFSLSNDCIRDLCRDIAVRYTYDYVSRYRRYGAGIVYQLDGARTQKSAEYFLRDAQRLGLNAASIPDVGVNLWSDFEMRAPMNRQLMQQMGEGVLASFHEKMQLALPNPNAYALTYASKILDMPTTDSAFRMTDECIPFYQAVVRGSIDYVCEPLNYADDHRMALLQAVEYGSGLQYAVSAETTALLKETDYSYVNKGRFTDWDETIQESYIAAASVLEKVAGLEMIHHERVSFNLYTTTYADGTCIAVNYGAQAAQVNGVEVPPMSFAVVKGGEGA